MSYNLSEQELTILGPRTEGWAAGMRLAALSLKEVEDRSLFICNFSGDNHCITDYLMEEVLKHQSEFVRQFLLAISILERLNGPLCDAVTGQGGSAALLMQLEQPDMLLIPLDQCRHWYRYHHLFAELLRQQLEQQADLSVICVTELQRYRHYDIKAALLPLVAPPELDHLTLALHRGDMGALDAWQRQSTYSSDEDIPAGSEHEYVLYARLLLYQGDAQGAARIAAQAFVSVNTVKTHLKNIYAKLGVDNRVQAMKNSNKFRLVGVF